MIRRTLVVLAGLALGLAACGDDDTDGAADTGTIDRTDPVDGGDEGGTNDDSVTIAGFAFEPATLEVSAGTTVTWTNDDGATHTVTAGAPGEATGEFDESVADGEQAEVTFDEPGTFDYFCSIHPAMTAEVTVT